MDGTAQRPDQSPDQSPDQTPDQSPDQTPDQTPATRRRPGSRLVATAAVLIGAGAVVVAAGRPWLQVTVVGLSGPDVVPADGRLVAPGATALALVAAAGAVVLATSGRAVRLIVAGLLVLAGVGVGAPAVSVLAAPGEAVEATVARATGTTGGSFGAVASPTLWPVVVIVAALLVVTGGLIGVIRGRCWSGPARRFERPGAAVGAAAGTNVSVPPAVDPPARARSAKDDRLDAWDRLSAGDDPTD